MREILVVLWSFLLIRTCIPFSIEYYPDCSDFRRTEVDTALVFFENDSYDLYGINSDCYKCSKSLILYGQQSNPGSKACASMWTPHPWKLLLIRNETGEEIASKSYLFEEKGEYLVYPSSSSDVQMVVEVTVEPIDSNVPLYYLFGVLFLLASMFFLCPFLYDCYLHSDSSSHATNLLSSSSDLIKYTTVPFIPKSSSADNSLLGQRKDAESLSQEANQSSLPINNDTSQSPMQPSVYNTYDNEDRPLLVPKKERLQSLDTFRGFALTVMIFVNYGGGGYWFFEHAAWNGLTVADLLFPWFMWMMGVSMALSFTDLLPKSNGSSANYFVPWKVWKRVIRRTLILFGLGMFLANGWEYSTWRIPGVLQYFSVSYCVTALTVLCVYHPTQRLLAYYAQRRNVEYTAEQMPIRTVYVSASNESASGSNIIYRVVKTLCICFCPCCVPDTSHSNSHMNRYILLSYSYEWLIQSIILIIYLAISYGVAAPNCPVGYLGPGGLSEESQYFDCTGGIHRYIDLQLFGYNLIYHHPTCMEVYNCIPYDPEGFLGVFSACTLTYLGLMSGRIIVHYKTHRERLLRWIVWSFGFLFTAALLCNFSQNDGIIPVNKNLWSSSFVLISAGGGLIGLAVCYVLIDVNKWWTGAPFRYLGMNSILIYCAHGVFQEYMPFSYKIYTPVTHAKLLTSNVIGVFCWILIAFYFYRIKFFVKI